jgi:hypothetical protein
MLGEEREAAQPKSSSRQSLSSNRHDQSHRASYRRDHPMNRHGCCHRDH